MHPNFLVCSTQKNKEGFNNVEKYDKTFLSKNNKKNPDFITKLKKNKDCVSGKKMVICTCSVEDN